MKNEDVLDALEGVSEEYVDEVALLRRSRLPRKKNVLPWAAAAASLLIALGAGFILIKSGWPAHGFFSASAPTEQALTVTETPYQHDPYATGAPAGSDYCPPEQMWCYSYDTVNQASVNALTLSDEEYREQMAAGSTQGMFMSGANSRQDMLEIIELLRNVPLPYSDMLELKMINLTTYFYENPQRRALYMAFANNDNTEACFITIELNGDYASFDACANRFSSNAHKPELLPSADYPEYSRIAHVQDIIITSTVFKHYEVYLGERGGYAIDLRISSSNDEWISSPEEYLSSFTYGTFDDIIPDIGG